MQRSTLPQRSFEIHPAFVRSRRVAIAICVVMLAGSLALAIYCASDIVAIRREAAIWARGTVAPDARVDATGTVKVVFVHYKIRVDYQAADGPHHGEQELITIGGGARIDTRAVLRYDADHPESFATSVGIDAISGRWGWILGMDGFLVFVAVVMALQLRRSRRDLERTRALAREGNEVVATILATEHIKLSNGRQTPYVKIKWQAGAHGPFDTQLDTRKGTFARTSRDGEAIAVISSDGKAGVLLRQDLYPLLATPEEIEAAAARRTPAT